VRHALVIRAWAPRENTNNVSRRTVRQEFEEFRRNSFNEALRGMNSRVKKAADGIDREDFF
jgi:hypothetical protein